MNVAGRSKPERGESVMRYNRPATSQTQAAINRRQPSGQTKSVWIEHSLMDMFTAEGTDAHRLCTIDEGWVERFGREILVSFKNIPARDRLVTELYFWRTSQNFDFLRIFGRFLPKKNEEREKPQLLFGEGDHNLQTIATENFLKYGI